MSESSHDRRVGYLRQLRRILPRCEVFENWLNRSGELPPDFSLLPPRYRPPDPLIHDNGRPVTAASWPLRRVEIVAALEQWVFGHAPPPPGSVQAEILSIRQRPRDDVWRIRLSFGPNHAATLPCLLVVPRGLSGPAPVFLANFLLYRMWVGRALHRGMIFCSYGACDDSPDMGPVPPDASRPWRDIWPGYDWGAFRRRGWAASRVVDWLTTLPQVDAGRIYIGGHSRSAKQAMAAAAFDMRFAGVLASSPGSGGSVLFRDQDESTFGESIEILTRVFPEWLTPRLRFFAGREHLLPTDCHMIYALLAPRPVLMSTATADWVESTFAVEHMRRLARPVYDMLGGSRQLALRYRDGHHGWMGPTRRAYDKFLWRLSRGESAAAIHDDADFHDGSYVEWLAHNPPASAPPGDAAARLAFLLGEGPVAATSAPKPAVFGQGESAESQRLHVRNWPAPPRREPWTFGDGVFGHFYRPAGAEPGDGRRPAVIWLSPFACSNGFTGSYRSGEIAHIRLSNAGFAHVLAFDPIGTGSRQAERRGFYNRHPRWSLMGRMVLDTRHAVDALTQHPEVDSRRVYLYGFGLGAITGLFAALLDHRVAGVAAVGGWTPLRAESSEAARHALIHWSRDLLWLPRLGWSADRPGDLPLDFADVLAGIGPRRVHLITLALERHVDHTRIVETIEAVMGAHPSDRHGAALTAENVEEFCRLTDAIQDQAIAVLRQWAAAPLAR